MSQDIEVAKARIVEILEVNPSREACLVRLRQEGWDDSVSGAVLDQYLEERRRSAKARRQAEEDRAIVLGRLLEGASVPFDANLRGLADVALVKRAGLRQRRRKWAELSGANLLVTLALAGLTVFAVHQEGPALLLDAWPVRWGPLPLATVGSLGSAIFFLREWRTARRRSRALEAFAGQYGWW